jgi:pSer/pThr/pTyr-binding forkhead associated (FHA) protein
VTELEIVTGPLAGRRIPLRGEVTVGRADTDLELNDAEVSRVHAVLRPRPDGTVEVEDLGSTNGTYVGEERVAAPSVLQPGGQLRVGSTVLRLLGAAPTAAHAAPPTEERAVPPRTAAPAAAPAPATFAVPTVRRRRGERSASLLVAPTVLTFAAIAATAIALLVYFVAR